MERHIEEYTFINPFLGEGQDKQESNLGGYENQCPSILFDDHRVEALPAIDALPEDVEERLRQARKKVA